MLTATKFPLDIVTSMLCDCYDCMETGLKRNMFSGRQSMAPSMRIRIIENGQPLTNYGQIEIPKGKDWSIFIRFRKYVFM